MRTNCIVEAMVVTESVGISEIMHCEGYGSVATLFFDDALIVLESDA